MLQRRLPIHLPKLSDGKAAPQPALRVLQEQFSKPETDEAISGWNLISVATFKDPGSGCGFFWYPVNTTLLSEVIAAFRAGFTTGLDRQPADVLA